LNKINVGITGFTGFIGKSLINFFYIKPEINLILLDDEDFNDKKRIEFFVKNTDVIIHLAAINRDKNPNNLYRTNIRLVKLLINACEESNSKPKIFFSSSTQENLDNPYGKSKLEGRKLFEKWARDNKCDYTTLIIPNVFGPNCKPFYNSVVSTFCFQLINSEKPLVNNDVLLNFIYVYDLSEYLYNLIVNRKKLKNCITIKSKLYIKVSDLLLKIKSIHNSYFVKNIFPDLYSNFDKNLFLTYHSYIPDSFFPQSNILNKDNRGEFSEIIRTNSIGQFSYSITKPGIVRGNHFHTRKIERFSVIEGKAVVKLRKIQSKETKEFFLNKNDFIDISPWYTHSIENIGKDTLITLFWINEHYDSKNPDTYNELV
jgi:UDP-2-acetamido-2,6-beta-L-arabino-hexul-4-ose reductase